MDNNKYNFKLGKKHSPKKTKIEICEDIISGQWWKAWRLDDKCYFEYDKGTLFPNFSVVEISSVDFEEAKKDNAPYFFLSRKYVK